MLKISRSAIERALRYDLRNDKGRVCPRFRQDMLIII